MKYWGRYRNYSPERMLKAVDEVKLKKTSIRRVAGEYGIPYQTLRDRISGKVDPMKCTTETIFTRDEEVGIVEHAEDRARLGYGFSVTEMQREAGRIAHSLGRRDTPKPLSINWVYGFLKRWESRLKSAKPSALDTYRAQSCTPESVAAYFTNLETTMARLDLLNKPQFVFNMDETGISPEHRPSNVLAPKNEKPNTVTSPRSATTTMIACANASGSCIPPYFVFKGETVIRSVVAADVVFSLLSVSST